MLPIISASGLSKKYRYGQSQPYFTLRDTLMGLLGKPTHLLTKQQPLLQKNEFWALKNITFDVFPGEVLGIIGPNGSGKSTLLKILSRITPPTTGQAVIRGRLASLLEVGTGFNPELTGQENLYLNGAILGMSKREIDSKFNQIVEFSGVSEFINTPVKRYSSGMYVRLAFAIAAHLEPEILLIDEVLAVGDSEFQKKCLQKMDDITTSGKRTILFVSHNMSAVKNLCKRCLVLNKGEIVFMGSTDDAISYYLSSNRSLDAVPVSKRTDRIGNGLVKFTSIKFPHVFVSGQPAAIVLGFESKLPAKKSEIVVELRIMSPFGLLLFSLSNKFTGEDFNRLNSIGKFTCSLPSLPLDKGEYAIEARCKVDREITDKIENIAKFYVEEGDFFGSGRSVSEGRGHFLVKHRWEVD